MLSKNLIYLKSIELSESGKEISKVIPSKNPSPPRIVNFLDKNGNVIEELPVDLKHNDFMKIYKEFATHIEMTKKMTLGDI